MVVVLRRGKGREVTPAAGGRTGGLSQTRLTTDGTATDLMNWLTRCVPPDDGEKRQDQEEDEASTTSGVAVWNGISILVDFRRPAQRE